MRLPRKLKKRTPVWPRPYVKINHASKQAEKAFRKFVAVIMQLDVAMNGEEQ